MCAKFSVFLQNVPEIFNLLQTLSRLAFRGPRLIEILWEWKPPETHLNCVLLTAAGAPVFQQDPLHSPVDSELEVDSNCEGCTVSRLLYHKCIERYKIYFRLSGKNYTRIIQARTTKLQYPEVEREQRKLGTNNKHVCAGNAVLLARQLSRSPYNSRITFSFLNWEN